MRADLHPDLDPAERRRLVRLGVDLFNRGDFFEAHEVLEEVWRSTRPEPRDLFQELIQVAAEPRPWCGVQG
jgi:predicted metal-dependent hydrolase